MQLIRDREARGRRRGLLAGLLVTTMIAGWWLGVIPGRGGSGLLGSVGAARADLRQRASANVALGANQADVSVPGPGRMKTIPLAFLGLSTEFTTLPLVEQHSDLYEQVLQNLRPDQGKSDLVVRIGGDSAEHVRYGQKIQFPPWAFKFDNSVANQTLKVMNALKLNVIVDINTISSNPREVAAWMKDFTTSKQLQTARIAAFELGNEPDIYNQKVWKGGIGERAVDHATRNRGNIAANLPKRITATSFAKTYQRYARALDKAARIPQLYGRPQPVPVMAPALAKATDNLGWIRTLLRYRTKRLKVISAHVYPYSACAKPGQTHYPTIHKILSENATAGMARTARPAIALAHRHGLSLRLTEINSVTCGGTLGVSNTFATALWAPDALFELLNAGVEGVQLHARVESINRPFSFTSRGLETRPLLYGLILFARMESPGDRLVPVQLRSSRNLHLKVWAVRAGDTHVNDGFPQIPWPLKVLVINKGSRSAVIHLHLPTRSRAFVQRLLARSPSSTSGVTLEGQHLNHRAEWQGKHGASNPLPGPPGPVRLETLSPTRNGSYLLRVSGYSAAMLAVHVAASKLNGPSEKAAGPALFGY